MNTETLKKVVHIINQKLSSQLQQPSTDHWVGDSKFMSSALVCIMDYHKKDVT